MTRVAFNLASSPYDEVVSARPRPRAERRHSTTTTTAPAAVFSFVLFYAVSCLCYAAISKKNVLLLSIMAPLYKDHHRFIR